LKTLATILCLFTVAFSGAISKKDIDNAINTKSLQHPYLLFSETDKAAMRSRIESDKECRDIMKRLLAEAHRALYQPVDYQIPVQGKNTRAGWSEEDRDGKYELYYDTNLENALNLAFVYQMTGDKKYAEKAFQFADAFCDLTTWTQRAHEFPIIYSRIMPWNVSDDQVCFSFDHYNGDAAREMAYVYDWLYPELTKAQRDRIRGALLEKAVTRVRGNYEYHWWATAYRCNWCGVCNSGVGMAGLALLTEDPQLTDVVAESFNRITLMYNELDVNGGWQEGVGYWSYANRTSVQFAAALRRLTHGKYNLFDHPRLKANPTTFPLYMFVPPFRCINFEDSGDIAAGTTFLFNKLSEEVRDPGTIWYRQNVLGEGRTLFDIIWPRPLEKVSPPAQTSLHFKTIDFWVMRSDFMDESNFIVAGKAGKNDDPHHGHLDIGNVVLFWYGQAFLGEIERMFYDEKYFDNARWDYPAASSAGHNVVFVNGEMQLPGKLYKQPYNFDIGGQVLEFRTNPQRDYVLMDPSNAYPKKELKNWRRHVTLEKPNMAIILDEVECAPGSEIEVRFHSECKVDNQSPFVLLTADGSRREPAVPQRRQRTARTLSKDPSGKTIALLPVTEHSFMIREDRHANLYVNAQAEFQWIPYFGIVLNASSQKTLISTLLIPVKNADEAKAIQQSASLTKDSSGNVRLKFIVANQSHEYLYTSEKQGLVLHKD
jgi:hypothetical protein